MVFGNRPGKCSYHLTLRISMAKCHVNLAVAMSLNILKLTTRFKHRINLQDCRCNLTKRPMVFIYHARNSVMLGFSVTVRASI